MSWRCVETVMWYVVLVAAVCGDGIVAALTTWRRGVMRLMVGSFVGASTEVVCLHLLPLFSYRSNSICLKLHRSYCLAVFLVLPTLIGIRGRSLGDGSQNTVSCFAAVVFIGMWNYGFRGGLSRCLEICYNLGFYCSLWVFPRLSR